MSTPLRIIPLGGLGEIGLNLMVLEYEDCAIAVDWPESKAPTSSWAPSLIRRSARLRATSTLDSVSPLMIWSCGRPRSRRMPPAISTPRWQS